MHIRDRNQTRKAKFDLVQLGVGTLINFVQLDIDNLMGSSSFSSTQVVTNQNSVRALYWAYRAIRLWTMGGDPTEEGLVDSLHRHWTHWSQ